ncbi:MAG TPA: glycosyltransferase family 4 protein [Bryobacteraceae bacterium]|nr:glycosyltransferase family 4 protein [Bryobacteraceae bacterium]
MKWHIITAEFPPQLGGVSDYTYQLAQALTTGTQDEIQVLAPETDDEAPLLPRVRVHRLPKGFGPRWLLALDRALKKGGTDGTILVQYVPHGYGWKAMNLAFCIWLLRQRHRRVFVMFHEVAYPFKNKQPLKHDFLAAVHRLMAWMVLASAERSFTSIEPYRSLLNRLAPRANVELLRICSNVPFSGLRKTYHKGIGKSHVDFKTVGIFSNFPPDICNFLKLVVPILLENPDIRLRLIGPGEAFVEQIRSRFPHLAQQISTTGRLAAVDAGPHLQACDVLLQIYPDGAAGARGTLTAALASGVPVVTNPGHLTEPLFKSSGAVALADSEPEAICQVVEQLLSDRSAIQKIGTAGRNLYEKHFDISVTVDKLRSAVKASTGQVDDRIPPDKIERSRRDRVASGS